MKWALIPIVEKKEAHRRMTKTPTILFEDELIVAVNKPSGIPSHSLLENDPNSIAAWLSAQRAPQLVYLLHRLDTGTSGVLLFAKNQTVYEKMREKFKLKQIKKIYRAWSILTPAKEKLLAQFSYPHEIANPLAHHPKSKKRMVALPIDPAAAKKISIRGKPLLALTRIHETTVSEWQGHPATQFKLEIVTGVMHQIRAHLKHIGFALAGDPLYRDTAQENEIVEGRLALHAEKISFDLEGFRYEIESTTLV